MERIYLESKQVSRLQTFLLMTTGYREQEAAVWAVVADERDEDGTIKYPNAKDNADFWNETIAMMSAVVEALDRSETI